MKKIYDCGCKVSFDGGNTWSDTSIFRHTKYLSKEEVVELTIEERDLTYEHCKAAISLGLIRNASITKTLFRGKEQLEISYIEGRVCYTEKNYKPVSYLWYCQEENLTMKQLMDLLTADEFCEYLKDRGMTNLPIIK